MNKRGTPVCWNCLRTLERIDHVRRYVLAGGVYRDVSPPGINLRCGYCEARLDPVLFACRDEFKSGRPAAVEDVEPTQQGGDQRQVDEGH